MMNMSFSLTVEQIRAKRKTVTRRTGWFALKEGALVQPVVRGMGLKRGEKIEHIGGPIRIIRITREPLDAITSEDVALEGFDLSVDAFIRLFCATHRIGELHPKGGIPTKSIRTYRRMERSDLVTRIEFVYE